MANYINENSVILTEEDAEEFMNEYYLDEGYIVLEGKQAEEYLKRKQEEKRKNEENNRNSGREQYRYSKKIYDSQPVTINRNENIYSSSDNNPKFKTAREIEKHREEYGDVMPKRKTKSEEELLKARTKEDHERNYADKAVTNNRYMKNYKTIDDLNRAADAARRHYRNTHKNEASIFEQIEFI